MKLLEDSRVPGQQPRVDKRSADHGVARGHAAGLGHGANAVAQLQADVEHVADQPLGEREQTPGRGGTVQDHQVNVAIRGHVPAAVTAIGHHGNVVHQPLRAVLANVSQGVLQQFQYHRVAQIAVQRAKLGAGRAGAMPSLEIFIAFGQPHFGGQHVRSEHRVKVQRVDTETRNKP